VALGAGTKPGVGGKGGRVVKTPMLVGSGRPGLDVQKVLASTRAPMPCCACLLERGRVEHLTQGQGQRAVRVGGENEAHGPDRVGALGGPHRPHRARAPVGHRTAHPGQGQGQRGSCGYAGKAEARRLEPNDPS
jgi:hypothetical protein